MINLHSTEKKERFSIKGWVLRLIIAGGAFVFDADAGVGFHTTSNTFNSAVTGLVYRGVENWSSAGNAPFAAVSDPLSPGVAKGPFPNGTAVAVGIRVQSNSLGNNPTNVSFGAGMFYAPTGFVGNSGNAQPSNQLSTTKTNESFDIIFNTIGQNLPRAVSFSPMYYRGGLNNSATLTIRVYNQANTLLGTTTVPNVQDCLETAYLGIVTTGSDTVGRVNIWVSNTDVVGADNILVYGGLPAAPVLQSPSWSANAFAFRLDGEAGQRYAIQTSTTLTNWQPVQTNTLTTNSIQLSITATNKFRFHRAQWVP